MSKSSGINSSFYHLKVGCGLVFTVFAFQQLQNIIPLSLLIELYNMLVLSSFTYLRGLLATNQFCQALLFGSVSTFVAYAISQCYRILILPLFTGWQSSITIHNTDSNFEAVIDYLSEFVMKDTPQCNLQAATKVKKKSHKDYIAEWLGSSSRKSDTFEFRPDADYAIHQFYFEGVKVYLTRSKSSDPLMGGYSEIPFTPQTLKLSVWGSDTTALRNLLSAAIEASNSSSNEGLVTIFTQSNSSWLTGWEASLTKKARTRESVILDQQHMDTLLDDAKTFLSQERGQWYANMGIPYRRGYLLYGPPGCGKTSFAQVLAGELGVNICMLNLSHAGMDDNKLSEYLRDAPASSIIVLEDVDAVFVERGVATEGKEQKSKSSVSISFSGLLNAIDGVASQEGRIFFMTTNHIEKLDPALVRPGRCDVKLELKHASKQQMIHMFLRFFPGEIRLAELFASRLPVNELSMAALQGHFLVTEQTAQECIDKTPTLLEDNRPQRTQPETLYDHLRRLGIEGYAPLLESIGIELASQFSTSQLTLDDLLKMSLELRYDMNAQKMFSQLLASYKSPNTPETLTFLSMEYALADSLSLREAFMTAYSPASSGDASRLLPSQANDLCHQFCSMLSMDGRGVISLNALQRLLAMFPARPEACVSHIPSFLTPRAPHEKVHTSLDLYAFLKRAGMGKHLHNFDECASLDALLAIDKSSVADMKTELKPYKLTEDDASDLAEILTKIVTTRGTVHKFNLPNRKRLIDTFTRFYSTVEFSPEDAEHDKQVLQHLGFQFGSLLTDERGNGLVSLLEVDKYLQQYPKDASAAVSNILKYLLQPPRPEGPPPPAPTPPPSEWVYGWLKRGEVNEEEGEEGGGEELEKYATFFVEEGLSSREDLAVGPALADAVLSSVLNVSKLGHRRKIMRMQARLMHGGRGVEKEDDGS